MSISKLRHEETTSNGEPLYIVQAYLMEIDPKTGRKYKSNVLNTEYEGRRYGVRFWNGVGRTKHEIIARWFSEQFDYTIVLHKDAKPWTEATIGVSADTVEIPGEDSDYTNDAENYTEDDYVGTDTVN